jgi:hypothetical protein
MKRPGLLFATLLTLLLTGSVLARAGWLSSRSSRAEARAPEEAPGHVRSHSAPSSEAVWRWHDAQPNHWRAYLLQGTVKK